jgi:carbon storage regulator
VDLERAAAVGGGALGVEVTTGFIISLERGSAMLVLSRRPGQEIVIGDEVRLTVVSIRGNTVRLGITAPAETRVRRAELRRAADRPSGHDAPAATG